MMETPIPPQKPILTINEDRLPADEAYMQIAEITARRSKARRLQVGAIIVRGTQLMSDGYNGMPAGCKGEDEICEYIETIETPPNQGDPYGDTRYEVRTKPEVLHAEANAILKCALNGRETEGATLYTTYSPCPECAKLIKQAGIKRVVFRNHYRRPEGVGLLTKWGIKCEQLDNFPDTVPAAAFDVPVQEETAGPMDQYRLPEGKLIIPTLDDVLELPKEFDLMLTYDGVVHKLYPDGMFGLAMDPLSGGENGSAYLLNEFTAVDEDQGRWQDWPANTRIFARVTTSHAVKHARKL